MSADQKRKERATQVVRHGVARVLSKMGLASRTQASVWVREGRVTVNQQIVRDPEHPVVQGVDDVRVDGQRPQSAARHVIMLNKPRGLVTTTSDEKGRDTVYQCFANSHLPWLAPVGRLDKASEGLLLFCNDPVWAAQITDGPARPDKTYHVQVNANLDDSALAQIAAGAEVEGEFLSVVAISVLRSGKRNSWLEIVLNEGKNRHIRRLLSHFNIRVVRLMRVAIGTVVLGTLAKGQWRPLDLSEIDSLTNHSVKPSTQ